MYISGQSYPLELLSYQSHEGATRFLQNDVWVFLEKKIEINGLKWNTKIRFIRQEMRQRQ